MSDLGKSFERLKSYAFITYRGCRVERKPGAWVYQGVDYYTKEALDAAIDARCKIIGNSLKTNK